jgi:hypothetical protein
MVSDWPTAVTGRLVPAVGVLIAVLVLSGGTGNASGAVAGPGWRIESFSTPTNFTPSDDTACAGETCDEYQVSVVNAGSVATNGGSVTLTDTPPPGVRVTEVQFIWSGLYTGPNQNLASEFCTEGSTIRCTIPEESFLSLGPVEPGDTLKMAVHVELEAGTSGSLENKASISGGGAAEVSTSSENRVSSISLPFGSDGFDFYIGGLDGGPDIQAGDHPYELTTTIDLNKQVMVAPTGSVKPTSVQDLKDVVVDLPLGFAGSTLSAPECTLAQLTGARCPPDTVVGHLVTEPKSPEAINSPIWNIVPEHGVPAEFGYLDGLHSSHVLYVHVVPTPQGYVLQTVSPDAPQILLGHIEVTFYGDPGEKAAERKQLEIEREVGHPVEREQLSTIPFFTNPTSCASGPLVAKLYLDSWQNPARMNPDGTPDLSDPKWVSAESASPPVSGCNALQFTPELKAQPTTNVADSPSGLEFEMKLPQTEIPNTTATPALDRAEVVLPEGMTVDPSAGNGLQACSEAQIGWLGGAPKNFDAAAPECPEASKIGSLELVTPLIPGTLTGAMYIARQNENPFGSVLAAYVVVDDPVTGVLIKLVGKFMPDPHTGRITAVFEENPQLPFSDLKLHFFGGPRAELATPENCGLFTTASDLTPWSAPDSGPDATPTDGFLVESGCVNGFNPLFTAGSTNLQAGAYSPFVASFSRQDADQDMAGLSVALPPGLLANLNGVPLCPDAQASTGTCPANTQVGTVIAGAGPGPNPLFVEGKAFLTGPYNGGPYGLSVVVPAVAGPFNFGTVVVRQSLRVDPIDAHVTDVSDPFPTILDATGTDGGTIGIPIHLKRIDVHIDRPGFTFNPTNCSKLQIGGSMNSTRGASSSLAVPYQVTNCATLGFKPVFKVSTAGKTSRANGASLSVRLSYPAAPFGSQANIKSVKVDLPKQLPSRLSTLQKACPVSVFEENPAACSAASRVGSATATTPILQNGLSGPAYFVSHGGQKFPELIIVLSGQGITVDLHGETFISKTGITSSTFHIVPDVPIGVFTLNLPEGANSALAAPKSLCGTSLKMPTAFTAQNGATIKQATPITVNGCPKRKKTKKAGDGGHHKSSPKKQG